MLSIPTARILSVLTYPNPQRKNNNQIPTEVTCEQIDSGNIFFKFGKATDYSGKSECLRMCNA